LLSAVYKINLFIHCPEIINHTHQKKTTGQQVDNPGNPLALIKTVYAECAQKGEKKPGNIVVNRPFVEFLCCLPAHSRNQKKIDYPADKKQAKGEEINSTGDGASVIKTVGAQKTENPENISDYRRV